MALTFSRDVLGRRVEPEVSDLGLVQLRAGASLIDLVPVDGELGRKLGAPADRDPTAGGRNMDHFALEIAPVEPARLKEFLASQGVEAGEVAQRYGAKGSGPSIYLRDPDGNTVELKGPPGD